MMMMMMVMGVSVYVMCMFVSCFRRVRRCHTFPSFNHKTFYTCTTRQLRISSSLIIIIVVVVLSVIIINYYIVIVVIIIITVSDFLPTCNGQVGM